MKSDSRWLFALPILYFSCVAPLQAQSYEAELNLGVEAYKNSRYEESMQHFQKATELDPSKTVAHLYLASVYTAQYIPGVASPENQNFAEMAMRQYEQVLDSDAGGDSKVNSAKGIAYLYLNMKKFEESKQYYQKVINLDPKDPQPYYSIGVIDWTRCYQPRMEVRARLGMRREENLSSRNPDQKRACDELRARNLSTVEEGMESLSKAIELRPDYDDAMAFMNLMYRERADLECDDPVARAKDKKAADDWVDKSLVIKKAKRQRIYYGTTSTAPNPR